MPNSMHIIDAGLPSPQENAALQDRVSALENYLYMLVEELRYLLRNLSLQENVNSASLETYTEAVTNPVDNSDNTPRDMKAASITANKVIATESVSTPALFVPGLNADGTYVMIRAGEGLILNSSVYGDNLPQGPMAGRIFFKRA